MKSLKTKVQSSIPTPRLGLASQVRFHVYRLPFTVYRSCGRLLSLTLLVTCYLLLATCCVYAGGGAGTTMPVFKFGAGARSAGMGNVSVGLADDIDAIYYNPGGLGQLTKKEVSAAYRVLTAGMGYGYVSAGIPIANVGTIALGFNTLSYGDDMEARETDSVDPLRKFGAGDLVFGLGYGRQVMSSLYIGSVVKIVSQKIDTNSGLGFGIDIGGLYKLMDNKLGVGLVLNNLGSGVKLINDASALPMGFKLGVGYEVIKGLGIGLDLGYGFIDGIFKFGIGSEYNIVIGSISIPLRVGYSTGIDTKGLAGLGLGGGLMVNEYIGFDFAWEPMGDLGETFRMSLRSKF